MEPSATFDPEVLASHVDFVRRLARGLARGPDDADEITAETFAAAVSQRPETGPAFRGWLRRVVSRLVRRRVVAEERRLARERAAARPEREPATAELAAQIELERTVALAFNSLDEPYRSTLFRRYWHDQPPTRIAAETHTPLPTVKSRLQRGLEQLRERLDAAHGGRREEWLGALGAWVGLGGATVAVKGKLVTGAVAALLLASASLVVLEPWKRSTQEAPPASAPGPADSERVAAKSDANHAGATDQRAIATREIDPDALPFASGVVVDRDGAPLAGVAVVKVWTGRTEAPDSPMFQVGFDRDRVSRDRIATTDADGRFRVVSVDAGCVAFWFMKDGFGLELWWELSADRAENQDRRVVLSPARRVRGVVRDQEGSPISNASVAITPWSDGEPQRVERVARHLPGAPRYVAPPNGGPRRGRTDSDGRFDLQSVREGRYRATAAAGGYANVTTEDVPEEWEPTLVRQDLVVDVIDAGTQQPIPGAVAIVVERATGEVRQVSRRDGERLIVSVGHPRGGLTWLLVAPNQTLEATIHVAAVGYHTETIDASITARTEPPNLRVELVREEEGASDAAVTGRVAGVSDAEVDLYCMHGIDPGIALRFDPQLRTRCAADSTFAFPNLPRCAGILVARAEGCAPLRADVSIPCRDVVLSLVSEVSLTVAVVDRAGRALRDAIVQVQDESGKNAWSKPTDAAGIARFTSVPPGRLRALAVANPGVTRAFFPERASPLPPFVFDDSETFAVSAGETVEIRLHQVERQPVRLHLEHDDGTPVTRANVEFSGASTGVGPLVSTEDARLRALSIELDMRGDARLELFPGDYWFVADEGLGRESVKLSVVRGRETSATIRLPDRRPTGTIRGRILELGSGAPVVGRDVKAISLRPGGRSSTVGARTTDSEGRFEIPDVPHGDVVLDVQADRVGGRHGDGVPDPASPYRFAEVRTRVDAGRETIVELELPPVNSPERLLAANLPTLTLDARVTDAATGAPLPDATLTVYTRRGAIDLYLAAPRTGPDGTARATVLAVESYLVFVTHHQRDGVSPDYEWTKLDLVPTNGRLTLDVALKPKPSR